MPDAVLRSTTGRRRLTIVAVVWLLTAMLVVVPAAHAAPSCSPYPDVDTSNQHCDNIEWLRGVGIAKPTDGLFHPTGYVTRGQMAAFLFRFTHPAEPAPSCTARPFPDVSTGNTFCGYIQWTAKNKIAFGYSDGTFGPNKNVTRGAMAALIQRVQKPGSPAAKCTSKPFVDVTTSDMFCPVISWMKSSGITKGVGDGSKYGTTKPVTRQSMATFLHRMADTSVGSTPDQFWFVDGKLAVKVSIESMRQTKSVPGLGATTGVYTVLDVRVEAFAAVTGSPAGYYPSNPFNWYIQGSDGHRYRYEWLHDLSPMLHADALFPGEVSRGFLVFDATEHGTIVVDAPGYSTAEWKY